MRNRFEEQLEELHVELTGMGALCEKAIGNTYRVLMEEDRFAAREIINTDNEIDQAEREIENLCLKLLLKQQPVARDLRKISAALKMITDMERIGDQAADIAEIVDTAKLKAPGEEIPLKQMAEATMRMVTESIDAYVKQDLSIARKVIGDDDIIDELFVRTREKLTDFMEKKAIRADYAMDLLMVAKYYERIGDHATNIAEWVEFSITGVHKEALDGRETRT
ncbi:MAG: phosphate signaling complex protein PhoU [Blautia sp.]|jgi:phosphate transport system protein